MADETERLLQRFAYDVTRGGFAQLLFNAQGDGLAEIEEMLITVGATRAREFYVRAIRCALADKAGYQAFLNDWNDPEAADLRGALQLLGVEYLSEGPALDAEAESRRLLQG